MSVNLFCLAGGTPTNNLEPHAEVLLALNKTCSDWTAQWVRAALRDCMGSRISPTVRDSLTQHILRERTSKRRLFEKLKQFSFEIMQPPYVHNLTEGHL